MNVSQQFNVSGEQPHLYNQKKSSDGGVAQPHAEAESQWRRVLDVVLIDGQIRYLVERGE